MSALQLKKGSKYELLISEDVLNVQDLEKVNKSKKIEYSPLGSQLKNQTDIVE